MKKCPYTFPHRSRGAMFAYLVAHESYVPMNTWNGGFVLAWDVKVHGRLDTSGKCASDYPVQARFDEAWESYVDSDSELFWTVAKDASRYYLEGEWTNYPGIEQGEWKFGRNGRSGGYFVLTHCPDWVPAPCRWRIFPMTWESRADYTDWLSGLDTATLRRFYRAIRVLDHDLRPEAVLAELAYHYAFRRAEWEQEQVESENRHVDQMEQERPDLYPSV